MDNIEYTRLSSNFWAAEEPDIYRTRSNVFRFYPGANVLSVSTPDFPDRVTGMPRIGKTVTIQLNALIESPEALKALIDILSKAKEQAV